MLQCERLSVTVDDSLSFPPCSWPSSSSSGPAGSSMLDSGTGMSALSAMSGFHADQATPLHMQ